MTIAIKPTASGSTIEQNGSTILTVDGSGNIDVANNLTVTGSSPVPSVPTFSAYNNGTQSVSASTDTKIVFDHENFDTNSNYDNVTNYRFTPTVAGYYQFNTNVYVANFGGSWMRIWIMKSGSASSEFDRTITAGQTTLNGSCILYANGTTDYFEIYIRCQGGSTVQVGANDANLMTFNAVLVSV